MRPRRPARRPHPPPRPPTTRRSARSDRPLSSAKAAARQLAVKCLAQSTRGRRREGLLWAWQCPAIITKTVGDGIAAVAPEIPVRHLDPRPRLPAFVFGKVEQAIDPRHHL